jgi:2-iminobutanoate/2-iminopropanoate deaminase
MIQEAVSPELPEPGVFSHAIVVPPGTTLVFASGATARGASGEVVGVGDIRKQTEVVIQNLRSELAAAGATLADVVKVTVFVRNIGDFDVIQEVRRRYFERPYPASSLIEVSALAAPELLIEIEAIAAIGSFPVA